MKAKKIHIASGLLLTTIFTITPSCMNSNNITEIWLVRHGQTDSNIGKHGRNADVLNATGIQQAKAVANYFVQENAQYLFDAVYSSDLSRAHATAQIIAAKLNLPVHTNARLQERTAKIIEEIANKHPGKRIIVVTHSDVLSIIYHWITGTKAGKDSNYVSPANTSVSLISNKNGKWTLEWWAKTDHLKPTKHKSYNLDRTEPSPGL